MNKEEKKAAVPLWERATLSREEASALTGIGISTLRKISDEESCDFVLWVGNHRFFKRKKLEEYLEKAYSI